MLSRIVAHEHRLPLRSRCGLAGSALPRCDIAPLHFAYDPMQQTGADHFVLAKLRRHVPKEGVAVGYRYGLCGLHQPFEIVVGQSQSQLIERGHGKAPRSLKPRECGIPTLVQQRVKIFSCPVREARRRYH